MGTTLDTNISGGAQPILAVDLELMIGVTMRILSSLGIEILDIAQVKFYKGFSIRLPLYAKDGRYSADCSLSQRLYIFELSQFTETCRGSALEFDYHERTYSFPLKEKFMNFIHKAFPLHLIFTD